MPDKLIQRRRSIHDRETPQREMSDEDEEIIVEENDLFGRTNSDEECKTTPKIIKKGNTDSVIYRKTPQQNKQKPTKSTINNNAVSKTTFLLKFALLVLLFVGILFYFHLEDQSHSHTCSFESLQNEFTKEHNSTWKQLQYGMEMILNNKVKKPAVYLLGYHRKQSSPNLIKKIAQHSSNCSGKTLVTMESKDFVPDAGFLGDYGHVIEKYKSKIKEGDIFLMANLNEIPAQAARAFHAICDTHSPIRKSVVIFLSLKIELNKKGNSHSIAEETLRELWDSELGSHELDPLITRVTDQVIILKS